MPLPIGEPSGITAAQPTSSKRRASTGSSVVYGSTTNPSSISASAASTSSTASGSSVRSSPITSSLIQSVSNASRASWAVMIASRAVKHPAVFGSTSTPAASSTSMIDPRALGSSRRSATVHISVPDSRSASVSSSWLVKPPLPRISRERNSRPAMTSESPKKSASLNRHHDFDSGARIQHRARPGPSRHDRALDGHRDPTPVGDTGKRLDEVGHAGSGLELTLAAVDGHNHGHAPTATPANRSAPNGAAISGSASPASVAASTSAVTGASKIP